MTFRTQSTKGEEDEDGNNQEDSHDSEDTVASVAVASSPVYEHLRSSERLRRHVSFQNSFGPGVSRPFGAQG